jgi:hypothetical protein
LGKPLLWGLTSVPERFSPQPSPFRATCVRPRRLERLLTGLQPVALPSELRPLGAVRLTGSDPLQLTWIRRPKSTRRDSNPQLPPGVVLPIELRVNCVEMARIELASDNLPHAALVTVYTTHPLSAGVCRAPATSWLSGLNRTPKPVYLIPRWLSSALSSCLCPCTLLGGRTDVSAPVNPVPHKITTFQLG